MLSHDSKLHDVRGELSKLAGCALQAAILSPLYKVREFKVEDAEKDLRRAVAGQFQIPHQSGTSLSCVHVKGLAWQMPSDNGNAKAGA